MLATMDQLKKKYIFLCSIAFEITDNDLTPENQLQFRYLDKSWMIHDPFPTAKVVEIQNAITKDFAKVQKRMCFLAVETNPEENCVELFVAIAKTNARTSAVERQIGTILCSTIFVGYRPDLDTCIGFRGNDHLKLVYLTDQLFKDLYKKHLAKTDCSAIELNLPECFQPKLRRYQERSIKWLLMRETVEDKIEFASKCDVYKTYLGDTVYKDKFSLTFYENDDEDSLKSKVVILPPGGILADEMGLGKTVEMLALILLNPRTNYNNNIKLISETLHQMKDNAELSAKRARFAVADNLLCFCSSKSEKNIVQCCECNKWQHKECVENHVNESDDLPHLCPECWADFIGENIVESAATFVVTPSTIQLQWVDEIKKHTQSNLRVHCYKGIGAKHYIDPYHLAQYDIVLIEYNILRREIYHTDEYKTERQGRYKRRFLKPTSPLMLINWWRVVIDEAQMLESNSSNAAELAHMLPAINRWAVTGTPIQRNIHDLYPLMEFLNFNILCEPKNSWNAQVNAYLLSYNKEPLLDLLQKSMWRTCKSKVSGELGIPDQIEVVHRFDLSNIEALHYQTEHKENFAKFVQNLRKYLGSEGNTLMAHISPALLKLLLQPLLKIRQCCSIPVIQAVNGESSKQFPKPKDLLEYMINKSEAECKRVLRNCVSAHNGLAGVHAMVGKYHLAAKEYKKVLTTAEKYQDGVITVDTLLQIHAIHNLIKVNEYTVRKVLSEADIEKHQDMLQTLDWKYRTASRAALKKTRTDYHDSLYKYMAFKKLTQSDLLQFLSEVIEKSSDLEDALVKKVQDECMSHGYINKKYGSMRGILYIIDVWHEKVKEAWDEVIKLFDQIKFFSQEAIESQEKFQPLKTKIDEFVRKISACHLFSQPLTKNYMYYHERHYVKKETCELCVISKAIKTLECLLISVKEQNESPCLEIVIIKIILNFLKYKPKFKGLFEQFTYHLELIDYLQIICKKQMKFWVEIDYSVKAFDELHMCKKRIRVGKWPFITSIAVLDTDIPRIREYCKEDIAKYEESLVTELGRLKYLQHLVTDLKPEDLRCPICEEEDSDHYVVLQCGHIICYYCTSRLVQQQRDYYATCPICRSSSPIYYSLRFPDQRSVVGECSTKISWIVGAVISLLAEDPKVKILIFSRWEPILKEIGVVLKTNGITFRGQCTPATIAEFKNPKLNVTCLLMPFSSGSKGLNLIEAYHIFLVEPILNPGDELQAIGRIHRFGQTKPTTVHRFIANDTIEENIYNFIIGASNQQEGVHPHANGQVATTAAADEDEIWSIVDSDEENEVEIFPIDDGNEQEIFSVGDNDEAASSAGGNEEDVTFLAGANEEEEEETSSAGGNEEEGLFLAGANEEEETSSAAGNEDATASAGGNEEATASAGGNENATASAGGNEDATASAAGNEDATASAAGNEDATASAGGNEEATASAAGNEEEIFSADENEDAASLAGEDVGATSLVGENEDTNSSASGNEEPAFAAGGNEDAAPAAGRNDGTTFSAGAIENTYECEERRNYLSKRAPPNHWELGRMSGNTLMNLFKLKKSTSFY